MGEEKQTAEHVEGFSILGGIGEILCVPNLLGQKEKNIPSHGPHHSRSKSEKGPLFYLLPAREKKTSLGRVTTQGFH